jgi:hypothetical protein
MLAIALAALIVEALLLYKIVAFLSPWEKRRRMHRYLRATTDHSGRARRRSSAAANGPLRFSVKLKICA